MNSHHRIRFNEIIEAAITEATEVNCDFQTYIEGLESMIEALKVELQAAYETQAAGEGD